MKNNKNLFTVFSLLAFANSIAFLLFAEQSIELLGGEVSGITLLMTKYYGAIALGSGIAIWFLRDTEDKKTSIVLVAGIFISMLASTVVGIYASKNQWFDNFDWLYILIDTTLTIWSGYLLLRMKK